MVEEKGKQREKDLWFGGSGVPAKLGLGELAVGEHDRGLLPPGGQDLATWGG